jgi:hypothetical protein
MIQQAKQAAQKLGGMFPQGSGKLLVMLLVPLPFLVLWVLVLMPLFSTLIVVTESLNIVMITQYKSNQFCLGFIQGINTNYY